MAELTLLDAAEKMVEACTSHRSHSHTSLRAALKYLHERHPEHCGGKNDPFDALRACSCSLNQLMSALLHGQSALQLAIRDAEQSSLGVDTVPSDGVQPGEAEARIELRIAEWSKLLDAAGIGADDPSRYSGDTEMSLRLRTHDGLVTRVLFTRAP
jgi:hypothetical protein